jgi:hypothetical protein
VNVKLRQSEGNFAIDNRVDMAHVGRGAQIRFLEVKYRTLSLRMRGPEPR